MHSLPVLGFDQSTDQAPLMVRWQTGGVFGGNLAPLDPKWMKAHRDYEARVEELRAQPNVIILEDYKDGF